MPTPHACSVCGLRALAPPKPGQSARHSSESVREEITSARALRGREGSVVSNRRVFLFRRPLASGLAERCDEAPMTATKKGAQTMTGAGRRLAFGVFRYGVSSAAAVAALVFVVGSTRLAQATNTWDPSGERMASTDRSIATDIQPRVFLLANGGSGNPGRLLVTRRPDLNQNGWLYLGINGLDMGLDAVAWTDGSTQRQRVFYVQANGVFMLPYDDDSPNNPSGPVLINPGALAQGYTVQNSDLAAVTWSAGGIRWMAVAAGATFGGFAGYICIFESFDLGANWWNFCSPDRPLPASNQDIVGVVATGASPTPEFYFQNGFATLSRVRRLGVNSWETHEPLNVPTPLIGASIVATPAQPSAQLAGKIELGVIGSDNRVYTTRITPTENPTWPLPASQRPALPGGVLPLVASKTALGAIGYHATSNGTPIDRTKLYVIGNNLGLYQIATFNPQGDWYANWTGPYSSPPAGLVASIGTITTTTGDPNRQPRVFGALGGPTYTLQEFASATTTFKDYIKIQDYPVGVGNAGIAIQETTAVADVSLGIMTGIDRNFTTQANPWLIRLRSSTDGGNSYDANDSTITSFGGTSWYVSDPTASIRSGLLHHSVNDIQFPANGCHHILGALDNAIASKISYRRGASASAIAALTAPDNVSAYLVDDAPTNSGLDHPWTVTTPNGDVHVVYSGGDSGHNLCGSNLICYWKLTSTGTVKLEPVLPIGGPPRAITGANNEVYAYPSITGGGWSKICTLKNAFPIPPDTTGVEEGDCNMLGNCTSGPNCIGGSQTPAPSGAPALISVGPELSQWPVPAENECPLQNNKKYRCFRGYDLRAVAADPTTNYKVYVVYMASAASPIPGIYFTRSNPGSCPNNCFGTFTDPYRIAADTSTVFNYDPQITVDSEGTIVVSYSAIAKAPTFTDGTATVYARISTDGGANFTGAFTISSWNTSTIPYHCEGGRTSSANSGTVTPTAAARI